MRANKKRTFHPCVETLETRDLPSNYLVAMSGSDSNNGITAPWLTIQHAADVMKPGDTVTIAAGTYAGFDVQTSGAQSAPIIFQAATGAKVIIDSTEKNRGDCAINIEDFNNGSAVNYITIEGLDIDNSVGAGKILDGIRAVSNGSINSTGIALIGNTINDCAQFGILTSHEDNILIEDNTVSNTKILLDKNGNQVSGTGHGIYVSNACFDPQVIGNTIFGNQSLGLHMNGDQSEGAAQEPDGTSDGNLGNIIGAVIENNVIFNNGANGINCDGVQSSLFENNLLYNNGGGIVLYVIDAAAGATNNVVVNNTISVALTDIMGGAGRWDVQISDGRPNGATTGPFVGSTGNIVFNNILVNQNSNHGSISIGPLSLTGFASNDNIITTSGDGGSTANHAFDLPNSSGSTDDFVNLATWQTMTGQDKNSATAKSSQLVVNPGANFHLLATGPAVDKGVASFQSKAAPTVDLDGNPRPSGSAYDIGAYEFQAALLTSTTTITPPASVVAGQNASFLVAVTGSGATPTGLISLYDGSSIIASGALNSAGQVVFQTSALTLGTHSLTAIYSPSTGSPYAGSTSTAVTVTVAAPAFTDSFNRATSSTLGGAWTTVTNSFSSPGQDSFGIGTVNGIQQAVATSTSATSRGLAYATGITTSDASVSATVTLTDSTTVTVGGGVAVHVDSTNNAAYVGVVEAVPNSTLRFVELGIYQGGIVSTVPGHSAIFITKSSNDSYNLQLTIVGTQLEFFVGGVLVDSGASASLTQPGGVGIIDLNHGSAFSNLTASQGLSFTDTFNPSTAAAAYSQDVGGFTLGSGQAVPTGNGQNIASLVGVNTSTVDVQAAITSGSTNGSGVVVQWNSLTQSGYEVLLTASGVQVNAVSGGVATQLSLFSSLTATTGTLEVEATGSTLSVYLNGAFLFSYTDFSSRFTSGTVGLASSGKGAVFTNFTVATTAIQGTSSEAGAAPLSETSSGLAATASVTVPSAVVAGQPTTLRVTVTGAGATPTGWVTLYDGSTSIASGPLNSAGQAMFETAALTLSTHSLSAAYTGDATYAGSTSHAVTVMAAAPSFPDSFNRGSSATLGSDWTTVTNSFSSPGPDSFGIGTVNGIQQAVASSTSTNSRGLTVVNGITTSDASVSATVTLIPSTTVTVGGGVAVHVDDNNEAYVGIVEAVPNSTLRFVELGIDQAGIVSTVPGHSAIFITKTANDSYNLQLEIVGTQLEFFVGSVLVDSGSATSLPQPGGVGIVDLNHGSAFSNFSASQGLSFTDTFNPSTVASAYSQDVGGFTFGSGQAAPTGNGQNIASLVGVNTGTVDVKATITSPSANGTGVVVQWNSATQSGFEVLLTSSGVQVNQVVNGTVTQLFLFNGTTQTTGTLEVQANGTTLSVFLNGTYLFTSTLIVSGSNLNVYLNGSLVTTTNDLSAASFTSGSAGLAASGTGAAFAGLSIKAP